MFVTAPTAHGLSLRVRVFHQKSDAMAEATNQVNLNADKTLVFRVDNAVSPDEAIRAVALGRCMVVDNLTRSALELNAYDSFKSKTHDALESLLKADRK